MNSPIVPQNSLWILTLFRLQCLIHYLHERNPSYKSTCLPHISIFHTPNTCIWGHPGDQPWSICPEWFRGSPVLSTLDNLVYIYVGLKISCQQNVLVILQKSCLAKHLFLPLSGSGSIKLQDLGIQDPDYMKFNKPEIGKNSL